MSNVIKSMEKHLDNIDAVKESIKKDIEGLFNKLNIKSVIASPGNTLEVLKFAITQRMIKKYIKPIKKESKEYVDNVLGTKSKKEL